MKGKKGITLIALIITIVILLIIAGVTIGYITGEDGITERAKEAAFKTRISQLAENANISIGWQVIETASTDTSKINAGIMLEDMINQGWLEDITQDDISANIEDIVTGIKNDEKEYVAVYEGEFYYVSSNSVKNNEKQVKWCKDIGIKILTYEKPTGIVIRNGNYENVNGVYLCTPKLDDGFIKYKTRYIEQDAQGNLVPGKWISDYPSENWYSYKDKKWANIYVENNGVDVYYVWIPRYCFKLDQEKETSDVKFVDCENNYIDAETGEKKTWDELKEEYQVPEAFTMTIDNKTIELPGYWAMKYTAGDSVSPSIINYDMSVVQGIVKIKNITINTNITSTSGIKKYTVALNGKIIKEITDNIEPEQISKQVIEFSNLKAGDNTINITALNEKGEIVGSMTKEYSPAVVNKPDFTGFDKDTTFYVTYDANGNEHSTQPIKDGEPQNWYEYGESRWANIVTRNNGLETYYVWIPRYEYMLDQTNERSVVKFIEGISTKTDEGYKIPEAFWFDKNGDGKKTEDEQIAGYWAIKYTAGEIAELKFDTDLVATSSTIKTKGIIGNGVQAGQKYNYYIDGKYSGSKENANESYEFTGLQTGTKHTILVEIREKDSDKYVGTVVKQMKTVDAKVCGDYLGKAAFYDNEGKENKETQIKVDQDGNPTNAPNNWYNYSESRWANIVVKKDGMETYYVWIPRYEFKITSVQQSQPAKGRTEVIFIEGTKTETDAGYQIPEAFTFNNTELPGYWAMKYTAGEN